MFPDFAYLDNSIPEEGIEAYIRDTGARTCDCHAGAVAEFERDGVLHLGYMVDDNYMLHSTYEGVRLTPIGILRNISFYEV